MAVVGDCTRTGSKFDLSTDASPPLLMESKRERVVKRANLTELVNHPHRES